MKEKRYHIGDIYDKLTIIEDTGKTKSTGKVWLCRCECGNICERTSTSIRKSPLNQCDICNNISRSKYHINDLTNQRFGKLVALEKTNQRSSSGTIIWKCLCDCGNICYIASNLLLNRKTSSCGCINYSIGERNIEVILKNNKIKFITQYIPKELVNKRFDFAILDENDRVIRFIEFDGEQHYNKDMKGYWNSPNPANDFIKIKQNDIIKNEYCLKYNIPLVRIPYWERNKITLEMLFGDKYLIKEE